MIEFSGVERGRTMWRCKCDCGKEKMVMRWNLQTKATRSCGCLLEEAKHWKKPWKNHSYTPGLKIKVLNQYTQNCRVTGRKWEISDDVFYKLIASPCDYCGTSNSNTARRRGHYFSYNGLDRVDDSKGYTEDNVVPCCRTCNFAKRGLSRDVFVAHLKKAGLHMLQKEEFGGYGLPV